MLFALAAATGPAFAAEAARTVYVTSNGWHTNVVLVREDVTEGRIPEAADFPGARFLEFGWGDAEYYPAETTTIGTTLRAAFTSTPAVLHVVGAERPPDRRYPDAEVVALAVDDGGLAALVAYIDESFARGGAPRAGATGPGLYPRSRFYPATGEFHLGRTCNTWTAEALERAGLAVSSDGTTGADDLMRQVRPLAERRPEKATP